MIVRDGAVAAALEQWNERRRRIFYPKTDDVTPPVPRKDVDDGILRVSGLLEQEIESINRIPGGTFHKIYRVRMPERAWIFKLSLDNPDFGFAIETRAMAALKTIGLPSLHVEAFDVLCDGVSAPYLLIEEARGRALREFEDAETQQLPEPLLFEFGRILAQVHQIPARGAGLIDCARENWTGLHKTWRDHLSLRLESHLKTCREIGAINPVESNVIDRIFAQANIDHAPVRLLHGDPGHHNVFSDGAQITALIDWEDALAGDPIFDIAYWGTFVRDEMRARFLDGYQTIEKLPGDFEFRYWLYYLRVALSKTVHRHIFGATDRLGRPPASRRIQKALSKLAEL